MKTRPRSEPRRPLLVALWVIIAIGILAFTAAPANAHSELVSSSPKNGATLRQAPTTLTLTFSDGVAPSYAQVALAVSTGGGGNLETKVKGDRVIAAVPETFKKSGRWDVTYRIVSADGHPVTGLIKFKVRAATTPTPAPTPTPSTAPDATDHAVDPDAGEPAAKHVTESDNPWRSVLVLALIAGVPVATFLYFARKKRLNGPDAEE